MTKGAGTMKPYWQDSMTTIYLGDCRQILAELPKVDLVLTDPPYEKEAHTPMRRTRQTVEQGIDSFMPFNMMDEELRQFICGLSCNWLLAFCQAEAVGKYQDLLGDKYRRPMVWIKPDGAAQYTGDRPAMGYESIVCAWCNSGRSVWNGGGKRGVFVDNCTDYLHLHPTQKPVGLLEKLIVLFGLGGIILDPFMGSGTTLVAAKKLGRKAIGIEISERYCNIAIERLRQTVMNLEVVKEDEPTQSVMMEAKG
jgi:site-specific DNA-methyltransferase (adenine-specific)